MYGKTYGVITGKVARNEVFIDTDLPTEEKFKSTF